MRRKVVESAEYQLGNQEDGVLEGKRRRGLEKIDTDAKAAHMKIFLKNFTRKAEQRRTRNQSIVFNTVN